MTIEQVEVVDFIGINKEEGCISLVISDHLEWDDESEKLLLLQEKINVYLSYIQSGQMFETHPEAVGLEAHIALTCKYQPNQEALNFFVLVAPIIEGVGFKFKWSVL